MMDVEINRELHHFGIITSLFKHKSYFNVLNEFRFALGEILLHQSVWSYVR